LLNTFKQLFSAILTRINAQQSVSITTPSPRWYPLLGAFGGFLFIILFVSVAGRDAGADITMPHEEWISAELNPATTTNRVRTASLYRGDNAISALVRLGFKLNTSHAIIHAANAAYQLKTVK